ncbi:MAG TPA: hypothetical protein VEH07_04390 [Alphaproteobacteria bacterium]|nr:hypothetical protein [Alphaproteobacteria bacterium]
MQRTHRFHRLLAGTLGASLAFCGVANARPAQDIKVAPSLSTLAVTPALIGQDRVLLESLHEDRLSPPVVSFARPHLQGARASGLSLDSPGAARERLDFGHIGCVALISREIDQYGRIRGVDFLTYEDAAERWNMKLNVKHGAMLQITRRWGGGSRPLSYREISNLIADNR